MLHLFVRAGSWRSSYTGATQQALTEAGQWIMNITLPTKILCNTKFWMKTLVYIVFVLTKIVLRPYVCTVAPIVNNKQLSYFAVTIIKDYIRLELRQVNTNKIGLILFGEME